MLMQEELSLKRVISILKDPGDQVVYFRAKSLRKREGMGSIGHWERCSWKVAREHLPSTLRRETQSYRSFL